MRSHSKERYDEGEAIKRRTFPQFKPGRIEIFLTRVLKIKLNALNPKTIWNKKCAIQFAHFLILAHQTIFLSASDAESDSVIETTSFCLNYFRTFNHFNTAELL